MSNAPIALLACPPDLDHPQVALGWLPPPTSGFVAIVATAVKVGRPTGVQALNLAVGYPADLVRIESLEAILYPYRGRSAMAADGVVLFALRQLLRTREDIAQVAILREALRGDPACLKPAFAAQDRPFAQHVEDPRVILFDRQQRGADLALALAVDTVLTGAAHAIDQGSLAALVEEAQAVALLPACQYLVATPEQAGQANLDLY